MSNDEKYMKEALKQAKKAALIDEVPIGCVIVHDDKIIARGYNKRNKLHSTLGHAEISAIKKASKALGDWRLEECTMYVTLELAQNEDKTAIFENWCRSYRAGEDSKSSDRSHESKSRMCRQYLKYVSDKRI